MQQQFSHGLLIGRFQPFHKGHLYLLQQAVDRCQKVSIAIGSANIHNADNPLSYELRKHVLEKVIVHQDWQTKVTKIFASNDYPSDVEWLQEILAEAGDFDVAIGNNDWTNGVLQQSGFQVKPIPLLDRANFQGTVIRQLFKEGGDWQKFVPNYLVTEIAQTLSST